MKVTCSTRTSMKNHNTRVRMCLKHHNRVSKLTSQKKERKKEEEGRIKTRCGLPSLKSPNASNTSVSQISYHTEDQSVQHNYCWNMVQKLSRHFLCLIGPLYTTASSVSHIILSRSKKNSSTYWDTHTHTCTYPLALFNPPTISQTP